MLFSSLLTTHALAEETPVKHPVFLLCPQKERSGAWSLSLVVEKSDPSKPLKLVLEQLNGKNAKDETYTKVLEAQSDPKAERDEIGSLDAKSFGSGTLSIKKDNALNITFTPEGDHYNLMIDMRITADQRFMIGGAESSKRNVIVKFSKAYKKWESQATVMQDATGKDLINGGSPMPMSGIVFPVTGTGIYTIHGVFSGVAVQLYGK